ncbi:MAG: HEAT repeat domain-containing protein [Pirellulales bacterium]|nr:HEAT repeat domain-containing protein [Pirellulales bacterium]
MSVLVFRAQRAWCALATAIVVFSILGAGVLHAAEAQWIWSPAHEKDKVPQSDCFFRKSFRVQAPEGALLALTGDNVLEAYVNGRLVGKSSDWRRMQQWDVAKLLRPGMNVIAVRVSNLEPGAAGLAGQLVVKDLGGSWESLPTDGSWRTSVREFANWTLPEFPDRDWLSARSFGRLGATLPWGNEVVSAERGARFILSEEFEIERIARDEEVGSLIAMTFDAQGAMLVSREGGHLLRLADRDGNGVPEEVTTYCDKIENVQGILALGSRVFVTGTGPEGPALYRLRDANRDGKADEIVKLIDFAGSRGEHGAHAVRLGPDGLIYVLLGNFVRAAGTPGERSPYRNWYEGDLIRPKHEDPRGHAVGIPAPGGTVIRTDAEGSFVETVAGGLRNSYDFAFNPAGELFTYDADMEWDRGAPWYRPTRVNHVTMGAEMGWRSGWSKWPEYHFDSLPAAWEVGVGSPTGVEFYDHTAYPEAFRGVMFACDWATGRIYAVTLERQGATYEAEGVEFLEGRPLNATDCAVGPDGALYFCTGGRGTDGGVYRVRYKGPNGGVALGSDSPVEQAIAQPQLDADWARAAIARFKHAAGDTWGPGLAAVAGDARRKTTDRLRAIDLMVFFGPKPNEDLLVALVHDQEPELRARAARHVAGANISASALARRTVREGVPFRQSGAAANADFQLLAQLASDRDALVRRAACEAIARWDGAQPDLVLPLLADEDRFVRFAAMRALQQMPVRDWAAAALKQTEPTPFCYGVAALLAVDHPPATCKAALQRALPLLEPSTRGSRLTDDQRLNVLRLIEIALEFGQFVPESSEAQQVAATLAPLYPTSDVRANRELVRLLVHVQAPQAAAKFAAQLEQPDQPYEDKLQILAYAPRLAVGWTTASKLALMRGLEEARTVEAGYSVSAYVELFAREFFDKLTLPERRQIIAQGEQWPASALSALASLPEHPGDDVLAEVRALDGRVAPRCAESNAHRRLRVAIIAVLGGADDATSLAHLRRIFRDEPEYRDAAAMSLTQHPQGESWPLLVESLRTAESPAAEAIMEALVGVDERPTEAPPYRDAILTGMRLQGNAAAAADSLLAHWAGQVVTASAADPARALVAWQQWYAKRFPDAPPAELPADAGRDKWSFDELAMFLASDAGKTGSAERGAAAFVKAQCASCHRCGARGETIGPDLTAVARRFQQKEILQSIVYPSHVISDQYASKVVIANGKSYAGMVVPLGAAGVKVLLSNGQQTTIPHDEIDDVQPSNLSAMPTGLLNALTLEEVADLFAYLAAGGEPNLAERAGGATR